MSQAFRNLIELFLWVTGAVLFVLLLFVSGLRADDLDDANTICGPHLKVADNYATSAHPTPPVYDAGWEHCAKIALAWKQRKLANDALDESKNLDLKKSRDVAKGLP